MDTSFEKVIGLDNYRLNTTQAENIELMTQLSLKLQQSIELNPLLHSFYEQVIQMVHCDSILYENKSNEFSCFIGSNQKHYCKYRLELEKSELGMLICTRSTPFTLIEMQQLEKSISLLIYPLRNALLYRNAMNQAHKDPLTGIFNRAAFNEALEKEYHAYKRHKTEFSLMMIDLDYFKNINDHYGHILGDHVLQLTAQIIKKTIRRSDEVYRYGGEEFVVILSNTKESGARFIAERIRKEIQEHRFVCHSSIQLTASLGICSTERIDRVEKLLEYADKALYRSKSLGRNKVSTPLFK
jgi:diguanylate cyclase (GGDEF)-like protein